MQQNTNTYGHESRERRPYGYGRQPYSYSNQRSSTMTMDSRPLEKPVVENNFPSLGSFPALGKAAAAKVHPETSKSTGRFNGLEEVVDVDVSQSGSLKPAFSYSSMASKAVEAPMKKIIEEKKVVKKSNKIDTKGKKVYMTQQQYLYDGHKYNADDVVIVDDNGQEIYFSDDDYDCNDSDDDDNNDNDDGNEAW